MLKEIQRRKELIEIIYKKKISNFKDVVGVISDYRKDPEKTLKEMKS